jgi:glutamyl-Q tRNA(Asp) synthetase
VEKALKFLPELAGGGGPSQSDGGGAAGAAGGLRPPPLHQPAAGPPSRDKLGEDLYWHDTHAGTIHADPLSHGDVILARKDAPASYHLAVTVDDAAQGITHIVRGKDLFHATHIHRLLQALLHLPTPEYRHHDLLLGPDGQRLAKRHGAPTLEAMRLAGEHGPALADRLRQGLLPVGFASAKA